MPTRIACEVAAAIVCPRSQTFTRIDSINLPTPDWPSHVVGHDVQRHFSTDVLECFRLELKSINQRLRSVQTAVDNLQKR